MPAPDLDHITLKAMQFHVLVGILPHEREIPQPLELDVTSWIEPGQAAVVDYRGIHAAAGHAVDASPREFLEEIAERVAAAVLALAGVRRVEVRVRKPHVPLGAPLAYVEVVIRRPVDG